MREKKGDQMRKGKGMGFDRKKGKRKRQQLVIITEQKNEKTD